MRLGFSATAARSAYRARVGDIGGEVPWSAARIERYAPAQLEVAGQVWSARASEAYAASVGFSRLSIALAAESLPMDFVGLAMRFASESLAHVELCARVAATFGVAAEVEARADVEMPAADLVVAQCGVDAAVRAQVAVEAARGAAPVAEAALHVLATDLQWHAQLGALYAEQVGPKMSVEERGRLVVLARQVARAMAPPPMTSSDPMLAELGVASAEVFTAALEQCVADVASCFAV